jgi:NAD(P)H-dependent FMN reductase
MIVSITAYADDSSYSRILVEQVENWLKQLRQVPDNIDKIGAFLYNKDVEPEHSHYDSVRFLLEIDNELDKR